MQNRAPFMARTGFLWCILVAILCSSAVLTLALPAAAEKQIPATPAQSTMSMLPHLEWLLDSTGKLSVDDLSNPQQQAAFQPLKLQDLPREAGTVWLRFTLSGRPAEVRPATMLLDMGDGVPDTPTLFVPKHNLLTGGTEWQTFSPSQRSVFLMPETRQEPVTAYIRMDGLPGLWFSPMLRTPHNAATALERLARPAVIVALGVIMLLCLLRGLTERGEWRIWTSLYTAAALVHAVWGVPATSKGHVDMLNMVAVLAPGVGLMILPHVGRHLLRTRQMSRPIDVQLFLLSLPGAALALLPLVPGYSWTTRFLDLWPAGTLLLVPTTLGAWLCGLPGARRFLLGCLLPPLGVAVGILGMGTTIPAPLLGTAPLWGLALGALIIAGTTAPQEHRDADGRTAEATPSAQALVDEDPNLRIVSPEELAQGSEMPPVGATPGDSHSLALEESLRGPMDDLLRDGAALAQCALPPVARQLTDNMVQSVHRMASTLAGGPSQGAVNSVREEVIFDLQEVLRQAHDAVSAAADSKNIALSWFMPPHLGQRYRGGVAQLENVLCLLLESAVRATSRGAVQLAVRRVPESVNPGHLLFSVTDSGSGMPPEDRSSVALARAWELAGANRGFLGVECSPHGATISFTLHLEAAGADMSPEAEGTRGLEAVPYPGIIVVEDSPGERQLLAFFLEGLGATVVEARSTEEAVELYMDRPAQLLIFDGDLPPVALRSAVQRVRTFESAEGGTPTMIMGLSSNDAQWEALRQAGFTHALPKPITRSGLRSTVCQLLPQCAAQESLTPEMDMSQSLPSLPLLGAPEAAQDPEIEGTPLHMGDMAGVGSPAASLPSGLSTGQLAGLPTSLPDDSADDGDIIDTGMPLLEMDPQPAPASVSESAPLLPTRSETLPEWAYERKTPSSVPDLFPSDTEMKQPTHAAGPYASGTHTPENTATMQLLPDMGIDMPVMGDAALDQGGLELSPAYETPEALRAEPVAGKSHADYLTSLLDGDDDLLRHGKDSLDVAEEAPEAHMTQAVREGAEEARRTSALEAPSEPVAPAGADAFVDTTEPVEPVEPVESVTSVDAPGVPHVSGSAKVDILTRAKEMASQAATPAPSSTNTQPLQAFDEVLAGTSLFVSDAAPLQAHDIPVPAAEHLAEHPAVQTDVQPASEAITQADAASVEPSLAPEGSANVHSSASVEWVGEPQPVGTPVVLAPASPPVSPAAAPTFTPLSMEVQAPPVQHNSRVEESTVARAPAGAMEWVGEPRPIERPTEQVAEQVTEQVAEDLVEAPAVPEPAAASAVESAVESLLAPPAEADTAEPVASPLTPPAVVEPAPMPEAMQVIQEDFAPLSLHPPHLEDNTEKAPRQSREERTADRAHLTLLPQSTPLMDFIISEPQPIPKAPVSPAPVVTPQAAPQAAKAVEADTLMSESTAVSSAVTKPGLKVNSSVRINITPTKPVKKSSTSEGEEASAPTPDGGGTVVAEAPAPAPTEQPGHPATPGTSHTSAIEESSAYFDEEDAVMFTPGTLDSSGLAEASGRSGSSVSSNPSGTAASATPYAATAMLRANYGSVGEPMPIAKPDSPAPSKELPLTRLLEYFDQAVQHARQSYEKKDAEGVYEGASYIGRQADKVGLRTLARMARCVADAGKAKDMDAVKDLLPELESTVERNRIALGG